VISALTCSLNRNKIIATFLSRCQHFFHFFEIFLLFRARSMRNIVISRGERSAPEAAVSASMASRP
jgi:hypothetical protein